MTGPVSFQLSEAGKERLRRASIELAVRVLRSASLDLSADFLLRTPPAAVLRPAATARATRDVVALVRDWQVIARSSRRAGLRYAARVLASADRDGHRAAIACLRLAADDIPRSPEAAERER